MTARNGTGAWHRLGAMLIQRRTALNPRYHNRSAFCEATGLKYRLVYDIEEARRANFGTSTLAAIEAAYQLEPGAIGRFLAGGELESGTTTLRRKEPPSAVRVSPKLDAGMQPFLDDVNARIGEVASRGTPVEQLTGKALFPDLPWDQANWDQLRGFGYPVSQVAKFIAIMRHDDAEAARNQQGSGSAAGLNGGTSRHGSNPRIEGGKLLPECTERVM